MMEGVGTLCCYSFRLLIKHQWNVKAISSCKACLTFMWSCSLSQCATPDPQSMLHILLNVTLPRSWNSLALRIFFLQAQKNVAQIFSPWHLYQSLHIFSPHCGTTEYPIHMLCEHGVLLHVCLMSVKYIWRGKEKSSGFPPISRQSLWCYKHFHGDLEPFGQASGRALEEIVRN